MKKILVFAVVLSLLLPVAAFAKAEFSLGGFIKLDAFWDSSQQRKNMNLSLARGNYGRYHHGQMRFTAQGSRFNFTIKGPSLFGAKTTGYLEMDFDAAPNGINGAANSASNSYTPRLRHAMFRFNWPETELLFGQYWSMFCELYPELVEDGPFQRTGAPTARLPQIRLTQKFLGWGTAAVLIGETNGVGNDDPYVGPTRGGAQVAEVPQIQAKLQYAQDLWGKAAYYGRPKPFTAKITAGWQRNIFASSYNLGGVRTFNQNTWSNAIPNVSTKHQYLDPWMVMGTVFVPVIATHTANLAGTLSLQTQWWIGQGVEAFGFTGTSGARLRFNNNNNAIWTYDWELEKRFGGYVQAQYYFTNQWFLTAAYGMSKTFGASQSETNANAAQGNATQALNQPGYVYAFLGDVHRLEQQVEVALWYRPIQAFKFGLEYAYGYSDYMQITPAGGNGGAVPFNFYNFNPNNNLVVDTSRTGNAHRVEFVGFFYF